MLKKGVFSLFFLIAAILSGCASTATQEGLLIWPSPPLEPKIVYLRSYSGEQDLKKKTFLDAIFGQTASTLQAQKPYGVAAQGDKIYVALSGGFAVAVFDLKERKISYLGDRGTGKLSLPLGVAVASDGTVFASDGTLNKVFGYDASGELKVAIGKQDELVNPAGIAVNNVLKRIYVVDSQGHTVRVYDMTGHFLFQFGKRGDKNGEFNYPTNVAIDRRNNKVYIVDTNNFRVQVFGPDGNFLSTFGSIGDRPGFFARPKGVGVDSEGNIYVADAAFENFQIFNENGQLLLYIGTGGSAPGYFLLPAGLYVDEDDRIYVADSLNGRIQVFQYLSEKWKKSHPEEYKKYVLQTESKKETDGEKR